MGLASVDAVATIPLRFQILRVMANHPWIWWTAATLVFAFAVVRGFGTPVGPILAVGAAAYLSYLIVRITAPHLRKALDPTDSEPT